MEGAAGTGLPVGVARTVGRGAVGAGAVDAARVDDATTGAGALSVAVGGGMEAVGSATGGRADMVLNRFVFVCVRFLFSVGSFEWKRN